MGNALVNIYNAGHFRLNKTGLVVANWLGGMFGVDRFMRRQYGLGTLKLLTVGGWGFWYLADAIIATVKAAETPGPDFIMDFAGGYAPVDPYMMQQLPPTMPPYQPHFLEPGFGSVPFGQQNPYGAPLSPAEQQAALENIHAYQQQQFNEQLRQQVLKHQQTANPLPPQQTPPPQPRLLTDQELWDQAFNEGLQ